VRFDFRQRQQLPRPEAACFPVIGEFHETLIADVRAGLTPADMVERQLRSMLREPLIVRDV
jgi:hypothetical protein